MKMTAMLAVSERQELHILVSLRILRKEISIHLLKNDHRHTDLEQEPITRLLLGVWSPFLLSHTHIAFLQEFNSYFPTSIPVSYIWETPSKKKKTGGTWLKFCWVCVAGLSEPLPRYSLFCGQFQTPSQSLLGKCKYRDPNLVTSYLCIYLIDPLNRSS